MNDLEQQIDRLVDGELDNDQQRALLRELDDHPRHWRDAALAFVEAQVWSRELRELVSADASASAETPKPEQKSVGGRYSHWIQLLLATAAGAMLVICIQQFLVTADQPTRPSPELIAGQGDPLQEQDIFQPDSEAGPQPVGDATFLVSTGGQEQMMQLPVFAANEMTDSWLAHDAPLPADVVEVLNQSGRAWQRQRELVPVELEDGRQVIVPINHISFESPVVFQ